MTDIADDDALPWLDYRGPPGPSACNQGLVTVIVLRPPAKLAAYSGALSSEIPGPGGQI